jgi:hypothetical protein
MTAIIGLTACSERQAVIDVQTVARVKDRVLTREEVMAVIPKGKSSADSLLIAENYIKNWVKDALVYDLARRNLGDEQEEINKLVEEYRRSLLSYRYQERLVRERLSANLRESDKINYYEANQDKFKLKHSLIRGLFLKIPADAPGLSEIKIIYQSDAREDLERIEKYSVQYAVFYDSFYDRWVDFDEIRSNIPIRITDEANFLSHNKFINTSDSNFCYLVNIKEYMTAGSIAPYEYEEPHIVEMLTNQRKMDFLRAFEDELFDDAIKSGDAQVLTGQQ